MKTIYEFVAGAPFEFSFLSILGVLLFLAAFGFILYLLIGGISGIISSIVNYSQNRGVFDEKLSVKVVNKKLVSGFGQQICFYLLGK